MISERQKAFEVSGNLKGDKVSMGIHPEAMAHIMAVLTDLYADPLMAVIREYSTNGLDAHIEAGIKRPIEVTTPTRLEPVLRIRDYGVGLSVQDIHEIYSQYGASTKRNTNDQVGMLGLGCKSALTYTTMFTIVSVKDGVRLEAAVSRDADGSGSILIVDTRSTTEANGVEIVVPIKSFDTSNVEDKANKFFSYWEPGTVLLNGKEPKRFEGIELTKGIYVVRNPDFTSTIVMGNVPYPAHLRHGLNGGQIVAYVNIGDVDFTPSRESLMDTKATQSTIARLEDAIAKAKPGVAQRIIDREATSHASALRIASEWANVFGIRRNTLNYKGVSLPDKIYARKLASPVLDPSGYILNERETWRVIDLTYHQKTYNREVYAIDVNAAMKFNWITGFTNATWTITMRNKLALWAQQNNISGSEYILVENLPAKDEQVWIDPSRIHKWEDIAAIKLPPKSDRTTSGRISGSYDMYIDGAWKTGVPASDIDTKKPIYFHEGRKYSGWKAGDLLARQVKSFTLVEMPVTRIAKFKRDFPQAISSAEAVQAAYDKWVKGLTTDDLLAMMLVESHAIHKYEGLDPARIDDPDLSAAVKLVKDNARSKDLILTYKLFNNTYSLISVSPPWKNVTVTWSDPISKYVLFNTSWLYANKKHAYEYLNAVYAYRQKGN